MPGTFSVYNGSSRVLQGFFKCSRERFYQSGVQVKTTKTLLFGSVTENCLPRLWEFEAGSNLQVHGFGVAHGILFAHSGRGLVVLV